jgi:hypothetical protein
MSDVALPKSHYTHRVLSIVDNRTFKRISYRVLDHDPTHEDIREFFTAFRDAPHVQMNRIGSRRGRRSLP